MQTYTEKDGPFNIILVKHYPCGGEFSRHSERVNAQPVEFGRACQWVDGVHRMIREGKAGTRHTVGAYMEPVDCPRPFTKELLGMLLRAGHAVVFETPLPEIDPAVVIATAEILAKQDAQHAVAVADVERMAADVARPDRMQFWQGESC